MGEKQSESVRQREPVGETAERERDSGERERQSGVQRQGGTECDAGTLVHGTSVATEMS